ncbi:MAG: hypothetical protein Q7T71_14525 [Herbiconiux sp.]|nr:hypothetical protein [Herbiconiux sp.]
MRVLASALVDRAGMIAGLSSRATTAVQNATFEGPASTRVRASVSDAGGQVSTAVTRLNELAASLRIDAAEVERQNTELRLAAVAKAEAEADAKAKADAATPATPPATPPTDANGNLTLTADPALVNAPPKIVRAADGMGTA